MVAAAATGYLTWRMQDYVGWIGIPALGAASSHLCARWLRNRVAPSLLLTLALSPMLIGETANAAVRVLAKPFRPPPDFTARCFNTPAYAPLSRLPAGLVMAPVDLGSFILDATPHSVVVAPYHRLSRQILAVHEAFDATPERAEAAVRGLRADYVVICPGYPMMVDAGSFGARLAAGAAPPWLTPLSKPGAVLAIYRVRPFRSS
jgi:hypothetical protein